MENYINEYLNFTREYIEKYSVFKLKDLVTVDRFANNQPYEIFKITINSETGNFKYHLISPRTHKALPQDFRDTEIKKIN